VKGSNGGFWHWWVSGLALSSVDACFSSSNVHSVDFASFLSQQAALSTWFMGFTCAQPSFCTLALARFSILFGGNFYSARKFSNTVV